MISGDQSSIIPQQGDFLKLIILLQGDSTIHMIKFDDVTCSIVAESESSLSLSVFSSSLTFMDIKEINIRNSVLDTYAI